MEASMVLYYENYTPAPDVLTLALCIVFLILIRSAYINRTKTFLLLRHMIYMVILAAVSDIFFHMAMNYTQTVPHGVIYALRTFYHACLFSNLFLYVLYIKEVMHLEDKANRLYYILSVTVFFVTLIGDVISIVTRIGFHVDENGVAHKGLSVFSIGYVFFLLLLLVMIFSHRDRIFRGVFRGVMATVAMALLMMVIQQGFGQISYTTSTYLFPIYALLYLIHSNPYDLDIGAVNADAFDELTVGSSKKKETLYIMSLYMHDFDGKGRRYPQMIRNAVRDFMTRFFRKPMLFTISGGHMILVVNEKTDPDYYASGERMLEEFNRLYPQMRIDYKIVFTRSYDAIAENGDYISFIGYLHDKMPQNSVVKAGEKEVEDYLRYRSILSQLADISDRKDPEDPRVRVYCQPVYNLHSKTFDTAEALMRLELPGIGMVFPDLFIPIAEKHDYIHVLSGIILSKTCMYIADMLEEGYKIKRISVNFSASDVRMQQFAATVEGIIKKSGIPFSKIAVEITESQNEEDFEVVKERISELRSSGIKFYLDDFGTGYSNFERIMELPFDIIKFDRSLVSASGHDDKTRSMVYNLAKLFTDVDYSVLYEGVEDEKDEERCRHMNAHYLQGYKYAKPIPIEQLKEYLEKTG